MSVILMTLNLYAAANQFLPIKNDAKSQKND